MLDRIRIPGVYVEEKQGYVKTITGAATSITAFLGRTLWRNVNEPLIINSYSDFEKFFGGLWADGPMSYAVRDFFTNGGRRAIIVRIYKPTDVNLGIAAAVAGSLNFEALSPGSWGNFLRIKISHHGITNEVAKYLNPEFAPDDLFNLVIRQFGPFKPGEVIREEIFKNLSVKDSSRRVDKVLSAESGLVVLHKKYDVTADVPAETLHEVEFSGGSDGDFLDASDYIGSESDKAGMYALEKTDLFNLLCIPSDKRQTDIDPSVYREAMAYCEKRRAMLMVDSPFSWTADKNTAARRAMEGLDGLGLSGTASRNAAVYFPHVVQADPLNDNKPDIFVPCGIIAGVIARTDEQYGVWKAPAGTDAILTDILRLNINLSDNENGMLNPLGINCLRSFSGVGNVVWGARTLKGADKNADEYKYISIRRLALYIEESIYRGIQWITFEPDNETLWAQIRLNITDFLQNLFLQGAFTGSKPDEAYFVKCDRSTMTQNDIDNGVVNIIVGFAPVRPAEFLLINIRQLAGQ